MNRFLLYLGLSFTAMFVLVSCNEEDDLPDEPVINSVEFMQDSKELVINFTDGDGNFGLPSEFVDPPFQAWEDSADGIINRYHNNLWLEVYTKEQGTYQLLEVENDYGFDFRIPELTPKGQNKQLRVTATYDLAFDLEAIAETDLLNYGDTLRFDVVLVDRDLNESSIVQSEGHILTQ